MHFLLIGFGGGAQGGGSGGWGSANAGWGVQQNSGGGWAAPQGGWASGSEQYAEVASGNVPQAAPVASSSVEQTVAATGQRSFNDLTHRVLTSIER